MKQIAFELSPVPAPTLENFVPGRNAEVLHALQQLWDVQGERFVCLWGGAGSGKTHLLHGLAAQAQQLGREVAWFDEAHADDLETLPDLLLVDDVGHLGGEAQIRLFELYNRLKAEGGRLVACGAMPPAALGLRTDLETRLGWGLVFQLHPLNDVEKLAALQSYARELGFKLPDGAADYLFNHWRRDMPSLLAAIRSLDRHSLESKRPVTLPLLRQLLGEIQSR